MPDEISKHNAALALIDGRGLDVFAGPTVAATLLTAAREKASKQVLGDGPRWHTAIAGLERHALERRAGERVLEGNDAARAPVGWRCDVSAPRLGPEVVGAVSPSHDAIKAHLLELCPWRKGPFEVLGVALDAEWRCDYKWARVVNAVGVAGKTVLDVGSGNGYYLLRAIGAGARAALGIDPTWLYVAQFAALRRAIAPLDGETPSLNVTAARAGETAPPAWVLPLALENLRAPHLPVANVVFSMSVLYHQKSPLEHVEALRDVVRPGGTLVLETLVVPGDERTVLVPKARYAAMRNVWMLPSVEAACGWLRRCGYVDVRVADVTVTSRDEQRTTEFMPSASLAQFLDPDDPSLTMEGYPAPTRALIVARRR